jgi:polynucleotide 5'-hydroxyl-kinase GRC3/NOL9
MDVEIDRSWRELADELLRSPDVQRVYVVGEADVGKSTLCDYLRRRMGERHPTAYLDCDCGQAQVGPPATVGLQLPDRRLCRFVGSTSPPGHLLQLTSGAVRLAAVAAQEQACCVIDSSGYLRGRQATEFQLQFIDALEPDWVVTIGGGPALTALRRSIQATPWLHLRELAQPSAVRQKSGTARRSYRTARFADHFEHGREWTLSLRGRGLHGMLPAFNRPQTYRSRLCALCDAERFVVTLALIRDIDLRRKEAVLFAPPFEAASVASIQFGSLFLDADGTELK